jgi:hypothetical protein
MAKVIDSVTISLQMWANVELSAEEIADIYPAFNDMTDIDDTDELETALEEYMNMNYLDHIQYADGALDNFDMTILYEDDGSE